MLNLLDKLPSEDKITFEKYVREYGYQGAYIGNEKYLSFWSHSKKKLYFLLGNKFIHKIPFHYVKSASELKKEIENNEAISNFSNAFRSALLHYNAELKERMKTSDNFTEYFSEEKNPLPYNIIYDIESLVFADSLINNTVNVNIKHQAIGNPHILQISKGMKAMKAIRKVIEYYELTYVKLEVDDNGVQHNIGTMAELLKMFEKARDELSAITTVKELDTNLCISIHPLDFVTMSDNDNGWQSCMNWRHEGCYRIGTVEMMNSNNVVVCYLESNKDGDYSREADGSLIWNNKKWRQLFYVEKDIIVGGKAYPYYNKQFTNTVLAELRRLAKENLSWEYKFGPEEYRDMASIYGEEDLDDARCTDNEHRILFHTQGMYNDFLNTSRIEESYICVRNAPKKNKIISVSGYAPCICCGNSALILDDNPWDAGSPSEAYNSRYRQTTSLLCEDCLNDNYCDICDEVCFTYKVHYIDKIGRVCSNCLEDFVYCPDCNTIISKNIFDNRYIIFPREGFNIKKLPSSLSSKGGTNYDVGLCCPNCFKNKVDNNEVSNHPNNTTYYWAQRSEYSYYIAGEELSKNKDKYLVSNLKQFEI